MLTIHLKYPPGSRVVVSTKDGDVHGTVTKVEATVVTTYPYLDMTVDWDNGMYPSHGWAENDLRAE